MEISDPALDDFYQDEGLNDGVSRCSDFQIFVIGLGEHSEGITEVLFDLTLGGNTDFVLLGLFLLLNDFFQALQFFVILHLKSIVSLILIFNNIFNEPAAPYLLITLS